MGFLPKTVQLKLNMLRNWQVFILMSLYTDFGVRTEILTESEIGEKLFI